MNNYNEPSLFAKLVASALSKHPNQTTVLKTHFQETILSSELLNFYEFITNSTLKSKEDVTLKHLCLFDQVEYKLDDFNDFNDPTFERGLVQSFTHQCILNALT